MQLNFYTYTIPFTKPFVNARGTYHSRNGVFLQLNKNGITAWGEAAPLPGFSVESLDAVRNQLKMLAPDLYSFFRSDFILNDLHKLCSEHNIVPSLQFGLFSLCTFYLAQRNKKSVSTILFSKSSSNVKLNAVIDLHEADIAERIRVYANEGYRTIKLKVSNGDASISTLKDIRHRFPNINIRLDANQSWRLQEAVHYLKQAEPLDIEYCEEPLREPNTSSLQTLQDETKAPIALDESLTKNFGIKQAQHLVSVLIIKPMVVGIVEYFDLLKSLENKIVFTSSLESSIGRLTTAYLASGLGTKHTAHGLATGDLLEQDIWRDSDFIKQGSYLLPDTDKVSELMQSNLRKLELHKIDVS